MVRTALLLSLSLAAAACGTDSASPPDASPPDAVPKARLTVTISGAGGGVKSSDGAIDCGAACTADYPLNTVVTLGEMPITNFVFQDWSGACSGTGACTVTITGDTRVTATFVCPPSTVFCN